MTRDLQAKL